jgi:hypothetical protein
MNNPLRTPDDYELFIYSLPEQFPVIQRSTLIFVRLGASLARVSGTVEFAQGFRLVVRERLLFHRLPGVIDEYGSEIWRGGEKLAWYDPQPHPNDPTLQSTFPHHKYILPNIKHNRVTAPAMSFGQPNLPALIQEITLLMQEQA